MTSTRIAKDFNSFVKRIADAEIKALNDEMGLEFTKEFLVECLKENPNMTLEEWKEKKNELLRFIFAMLLTENETIRKEFAEHIANKDLKKVGKLNE